MSGYVLKHIGTGGYVIAPGSRHSYAKELSKARVFTHEHAKLERESAETIVSVSGLCFCGHHEQDHGRNTYARDGFVIGDTPGCRFCDCDGFDLKPMEE